MFGRMLSRESVIFICSQAYCQYVLHNYGNNTPFCIVMNVSTLLSNHHFGIAPMLKDYVTPLVISSGLLKDWL